MDLQSTWLIQVADLMLLKYTSIRKEHFGLVENYINHDKIRTYLYCVGELNILSDDSNISEELISSLLDTKRAMLLKQQYAKNSWHMPIEIKQELCMDLELVDKVDGFSLCRKDPGDINIFTKVYQD